MGSYFNFKNLENEQTAGGGGSGGGRPPGNFPLTRQSSIYSMTFDEFQSTTGGIGKDFGSMNMDELLKNIWSAEEMQTMGSNSGGGQDVGTYGGYLQRQGSLTLPRTLSQKTVDEVWRDMSKEFAVGGKDSNNVGYMSMPQRQPTLGEMTLEEFLVRAGVVREDAQFAGKPNANGILGDLSRTANNQALGFGYQQPGRNTGLVGGRILENTNQMAMESTNLPLNVNGIRYTQQQLGATQIQQTQQQKKQPLLPKQPALAYGASVAIPNSAQRGSPGVRGGIVGISDPASSASLVQNGTLPGAGVGIANLGAGAVTVATGSPAVSSDGLGKSSGDTSSVSPVPYVFNGSLRGRKSSALEKVVERRQRRMIKNRESAARSRARKQAYTTELEAEVAKLKAENQELLKKQAEMLEMQKNQVIEVMNLQRGGKRRCLRRMQTGPW